MSLNVCTSILSQQITTSFPKYTESRARMHTLHQSNT